MPVVQWYYISWHLEVSFSSPWEISSGSSKHLANGFTVLGLHHLLTWGLVPSVERKINGYVVAERSSLKRTSVAEMYDRPNTCRCQIHTSSTGRTRLTASSSHVRRYMTLTLMGEYCLLAIYAWVLFIKSCVHTRPYIVCSLRFKNSSLCSDRFLKFQQGHAQVMPSYWIRPVHVIRCDTRSRRDYVILSNQRRRAQIRWRSG